VARLYYEYGLTHQEVAGILHLSRVKVTRLLQRARQLGIVQIRVLSDASPFAKLEADLSLKFGLDEALVVPTADDDEGAREGVAHAAARYLQRVLRDDMIVAIGLSRTVGLVSRFVIDPRPVRCVFVSMSGGLRKVSLAANPYEGTESLAQLFGGIGEHLHAPAIVGSADIARALLSDAATAEVLARAASADVALLGIGAISSHATLVYERELTSSAIDDLVAAGAVGDVAGRFFDSEGSPVEHELNDRMIGLTIDQILKIPLRIVVAAGATKREALGAALRGGLPGVLVTDSGTAEWLLANVETGERRAYHP
jgi:DNA-binding transcriptional regulator LsrR (DeoR family)